MPRTVQRIGGRGGATGTQGCTADRVGTTGTPRRIDTGARATSTIRRFDAGSGASGFYRSSDTGAGANGAVGHVGARAGGEFSPSLALLDRERVGRARVIGLGSRGRTRCRRDRETARQRFLRYVGGSRLLRARVGRIRLHGQPLRQMLGRRLSRKSVMQPECALRARLTRLPLGRLTRMTLTRPIHAALMWLIHMALTRLTPVIRVRLTRVTSMGLTPMTLTRFRRALRALLRRSRRVGRHGDPQGRAVEG